jgi:hypothetical protein
MPAITTNPRPLPMINRLFRGFAMHVSLFPVTATGNVNGQDRI